MALLSESEIERLLADHPAWKRRGESVERRLAFKDFADAAGFVGRLAAQMPMRDPYPEVRLHGFNLVTVAVGHENHAGMSVADARLLEQLDELAAGPVDDGAGAPEDPAEPSEAAAASLTGGVLPDGDGDGAADGTGSAGSSEAGDEATGPGPAAAQERPPAQEDAEANGASPGRARRAVTATGAVVVGAVLGGVVVDRRHRRRARRAHRLGLFG